MHQNRYFLGGNTAEGFYSCYPYFCPPEKDQFLFVIKGGPGCGKSSFMRKIGNAAEKKGYAVEYVLCSGDPDSLDGVYLPQLKLGYMDGTAPHTADVPYPAIHGAYLDLGQYYDLDAMKCNREKARDLFTGYKACYADAYRHLAGFSPADCGDKADRNRPARFLSAITCLGIVSHATDDLTEVSHAELEELSAKKDAVLILHPLWPRKTVGVQIADRIYMTAYEIPNCEDAIHALHKAKQIHDDLEQLYNPHVDFESVYALADKHI